MARILAIDYGKKRVGIAVTDPLQIICKPLIVLAEDGFINWLDQYIKTEDVEAIKRCLTFCFLATSITLNVPIILESI